MENDEGQVPAGTVDEVDAQGVSSSQTQVSILLRFEQLISALAEKVEKLESGATPKKAAVKKAVGEQQFVARDMTYVVGGKPEKFAKTPQIAAIQKIFHDELPEGGELTDQRAMDLVSQHPEISRAQHPIRILRYYEKKLESITIAKVAAAVAK